MKLDCRFMGLPVKGPLVVGASPLGDDLSICRRLEDQGAAALVLRSLFMEQVGADVEHEIEHVERWTHSFAEAQDFMPKVSWRRGPDELLEHLFQVKQALGIPVIGSLNGTRPGDWTHYAQLIEEAGADGLELNIYALPVRGPEPPEVVEERYREVLREVVAQVTIPVSVKLSPWLSSPIHTAVRLEEEGAAGFVLFNRLFPGEIDIEALEVVSDLRLSEPSMLRMRLMWVAAMAPHLKAPMCASGGVQHPEDVVRAVMAGADTVQLASLLLKEGPEALGRLLEGVRRWGEERDYLSLAQMRGSMSLGHAPNPEAFERANYMRSLQTWTPSWS